MKIRTKILLMALLPLLCLGLVTVILCNVQITEIVTSSIENGLRGTCVSVRDTLDCLNEDTYYLDGEVLYKGDVNISEKTELADNVKDSADTDVTVFYGDTRYMTSVKDSSGNRVVGTQAGEGVIKTVVKNGEEFFSTDVLVEGVPYFGYYVPLYQGEEIVGMIFAGMPQTEVNAKINAIIKIIVAVIVVVMCIATVIVIFSAVRMSKALARGEEALGQVAKGKLNIEVDQKDLHRKDEIGSISRAIEELKTELYHIIVDIKNQSDILYDSSERLNDNANACAEHVMQVERAVEDIAQGAGGQAEETQNATENVIVMGNMVEETTSEINAMNENAKEIQKLGNSAIKSLQDLQRINNKTKESIDVIYEQTNTTNASAQKIKEATELITDIAVETNLLSLNASIEAARAGEQGRGFAVVAAQIQKLAEQSNGSAKQIEEIINLLLQDSAKAVNTMNEVREIMEEQNANVTITDEQVHRVLEQVDQSILAISRVADSTGRINDAREHVTDTVQNLSAVAEENAASTEESAASVSQVGEIIQSIADNAMSQKAIAQKLNDSMQMFEI